MPRALVTTLSACTAIALVGGGGAEGATFYGKVGPGRTITLKNSKGTIVTSIKKGIHTFVINDTSGLHNFRLARGDTDIRKTTIEFEGTGALDGQDQARPDVPLLLLGRTKTMSRTFKVP